MKKALAIVAHPDDETIWMGGLILNSQDLDWTIFSLCRMNDPDRAPKFYNVCKNYRALGLMSDLEDEGIMDVNESIPEIKKRIIEKFGGKKFAYIFTHGYNGEYGHERHLGVHLAVKELLKEKTIFCDNLFLFSYKLNPRREIINKKSNYIVKLDNNLLETKKEIIQELYGFSKDSFESLSCLKKETYENFNFS